SISLYRLESRLARHLLSGLGPDEGHGGPADIVLPATQGILASMLNVSRSKLNAQLQAWQRSGLACRHGNMLHVHDLDLLRAKAFAPRARGHASDEGRRTPRAPLGRIARPICRPVVGRALPGPRTGA